MRILIASSDVVGSGRAGVGQAPFWIVEPHDPNAIIPVERFTKEIPDDWGLTHV
jgi:hypothetical protein